MHHGVSVFSTRGAIIALQALLAGASLAADGETLVRQEGEDRWVPSLTIVGGSTIQNMDGSGNSELFEGTNPTPVPLQGDVDGSDLAVSPFVGGALELMAPALPIPTRPRLFANVGILPTFASNRDVALDGDPNCVRGPEPGSVCAVDEPVGRRVGFGEDSINGQGTRTSAQVDTLVFGAGLGVAFPFQLGVRQLRIKPSVGWISYEVKAEGLVVDGACDPVDTCTNVYDPNPFPPPDFFLVTPGFVRETSLSGNQSQRFNAIGPGIDIEVDTGRFGPLGVSLLLGAGAYAVLGDRTISFGATQAFDDQIGTDVATAQFEVEVDPWVYRANVGIRFQWLGSAE